MPRYILTPTRLHFRLALGCFGRLLIVYLAAGYSRTAGPYKFFNVTRWSSPDWMLSTSGSLYIGGRGFSWAN